MDKKNLAEKRAGLISQLNQAANEVKAAEAKFNQVRGAIMALEALEGELAKIDKKAKPAKKGKK